MASASAEPKVASKMRGPTMPSIDTYLKAVAQQSGPQGNQAAGLIGQNGPPGGIPSGLQVARGPMQVPQNQMQLIQQEQNKLRQLVQKKQEMEHQARMLDMQIAKVQGGLEILQQMMPTQGIPRTT